VWTTSEALLVLGVDFNPHHGRFMPPTSGQGDHRRWSVNQIIAYGAIFDLAQHIRSSELAEPYDLLVRGRPGLATKVLVMAPDEKWSLVGRAVAVDIVLDSNGIVIVYPLRGMVEIVTTGLAVLAA
jgi:hypothetical protein